MVTDNRGPPFINHFACDITVCIL